MVSGDSNKGGLLPAGLFLNHQILKARLDFDSINFNFQILLKA